MLPMYRLSSVPTILSVISFASSMKPIVSSFVMIKNFTRVSAFYGFNKTNNTGNINYICAQNTENSTAIYAIYVDCNLCNLPQFTWIIDSSSCKQCDYNLCNLSAQMPIFPWHQSLYYVFASTLLCYFIYNWLFTVWATNLMR